MAKKTTPEAVEIRYDLFDLPTAQHKAGLAGLILAIRSLKGRSEKDPEAIPPETVPDIVEGPDDSSVRIRFTPQSAKGLFDDLYDADLTESAPREKPKTKGKGSDKVVVPWVNKVPMRIVNKRSGEEKEIEGYVYPEVTPRLAMIDPLLPPIPEWLKLWRNVLFQVVRDGKKQAPYKKRTAERFRSTSFADTITTIEDEVDASDDESASVGGEDLCKHLRDDRQTKLSSALYIGAQTANAEQLAFTGGARINLLLHFWPLSMLVFVPTSIDSDGKEHIGKRSEKDKGSHYVIAIPEVNNLRRFCELYPRMLARLGGSS